MKTTRSIEKSGKFPVKLYRLLSEVETKGFEDIISWSADGKTFRVHNKERFQSVIMPIYFGSNKFRSFQKSLNMWGFTAIRGGSLRGTCSHPFFRRDSPHLCSHIIRQHISTVGIKPEILSPETTKSGRALTIMERTTTATSFSASADRTSPPRAGRRNSVTSFSRAIMECQTKSNSSCASNLSLTSNVNQPKKVLVEEQLHALSSARRFPISMVMKSLHGSQKPSTSSPDAATHGTVGRQDAVNLARSPLAKSPRAGKCNILSPTRDAVGTSPASFSSSLSKLQQAMAILNGRGMRPQVSRSLALNAADPLLLGAPNSLIRSRHLLAMLDEERRQLRICKETLAARTLQNELALSRLSVRPNLLARDEIALTALSSSSRSPAAVEQNMTMIDFSN